jgi:hypothetical protein
MKIEINRTVILLFCMGVKLNELGWACGAYGGGERCAQGFGGEA